MNDNTSTPGIIKPWYEVHLSSEQRAELTRMVSIFNKDGYLNRQTIRTVAGKIRQLDRYEAGYVFLMLYRSGWSKERAEEFKKAIWPAGMRYSLYIGGV
nr:hypothetical protein [uncultured Methanospirillum sp.]